MKQQYSLSFSSVVQFLCLLLVTQISFAQGYDDPLTTQGLDHNILHSAASRAEGGITIGVQNDVSLMFTNPASLQSLQGIQISVGSLQQFGHMAQVQQYSPLKYYANFSLVMEGLTGYIPNPTDTVRGTNPGDTVQRPFDKIAPNWTRAKNQNLPIQAFLAVPFKLGENSFVAGIGAVQYADLNHYYQNNNVLSPSIGSDRPVPVALPPSDSTPVVTHWSAYLRSREGNIHGYGASLSGSISDRIALGVSGMYLNGKTDDFEQSIGRGRFTFYKQWFRLDSVYSRSTRSGTSDYSGNEFTVSGIYHGRYVSVGFAVKPPTTITRKWAGQIQSVDTTGSSSINASTEDKMKLPWRGTFGLSIAALDNLTLGVDYEVRSYASAVYTDPAGGTSNPWLSTTQLHIGVEYRPSLWLALRAGVRGQKEVFEQAGNPLPGEAVSYSIYSTGFGLSFGGARFDLTYEYAPLKYNDMWQTNVNLNNDTRHSLVAGISYEVE